jgi:hypothetical protein
MARRAMLRSWLRVGAPSRLTGRSTHAGPRGARPGASPGCRFRGLTGRGRPPTIDAMATLIETAKRARQLARAIASDLTLYHEAKIMEGIANDSLFDAMHDEIEEGRELFKSRVTAEIYAQNIYDRALVDVLVKSKGHVKSKIW